MNSVTRVMAEQSISSQKGKTTDINVRMVWVILLGIIVLLTALGLVYVKDLNRRLFIQYQDLKNQTDNLIVAHDKFLLEKSTWASQARVQTIAEKQLKMKSPEARDIILVYAKNHPVMGG